MMHELHNFLANVKIVCNSREPFPHHFLAKLFHLITKCHLALPTVVTQLVNWQTN